MSYWNQQQNAIVSRRSKGCACFFVIEGANRHGAQAERDHLQEHVLRRVTGFEHDVTPGAITVLACRALLREASG